VHTKNRIEVKREKRYLTFLEDSLRRAGVWASVSRCSTLKGVDVNENEVIVSYKGRAVDA
jgi:hypothetical protein